MASLFRLSVPLPEKRSNIFCLSCAISCNAHGRWIIFILIPLRIPRKNIASSKPFYLITYIKAKETANITAWRATYSFLSGVIRCSNSRLCCCASKKLVYYYLFHMRLMKYSRVLRNTVSCSDIKLIKEPWTNSIWFLNNIYRMFRKQLRKMK